MAQAGTSRAFWGTGGKRARIPIVDELQNIDVFRSYTLLPVAIEDKRIGSLIIVIAKTAKLKLS